jgi:hypothetical protein
MDWNYQSFNGGDTITLKDRIADIKDLGTSTRLTFEYTGTNQAYEWTDFSVKVTDDIGACKEGDEITLKATVEAWGSVEAHPEVLDWSVADTSTCSV